jgi:hypothetical protein
MTPGAFVNMTFILLLQDPVISYRFPPNDLLDRLDFHLSKQAVMYLKINVPVNTLNHIVANFSALNCAKLANGWRWRWFLPKRSAIFGFLLFVALLILTLITSYSF